MKRKMMMPLLAMLVAVVGAVASVMPPQQAWFKPLVGPVQQGAITSPADTDVNPCGSSGSNQCTINGRNAYDTEQHAIDQGTTGLLKRN